MTHLDTAPVTRPRRSYHRDRIIVTTIALLGVLVLLYPAAASWVSELRERGTVNAYVERIESIPTAERLEWFEKAEVYNGTLVNGLIVDPFSNTPDGQAADLDEAALAYLDQMAFDDRGVMSRISIPEIDVELPIFHGATDDTLRKGVGHLYGSSMPIGGPGTHPVLTGHSGLPESKLFNDLFDLELGDTFEVNTLGRSMTYQVNHIDTVEPTDISSLGVVEGRDLVTLVTCTPIGINTHRLIVQAERIADPVEDPSVSLRTAVSFPWWALGVGGALLVWLFVVFRAIASRRSAATHAR